MKRGSEYAKRIKRLYHDLVSKHGKPAAVEPVDPLEQLVIGILAIDSTEAKAQAVYRRITQQMVDLNELRVTPALELAAMIGDSVPHAADKARRIVEALNAVRRRQDTLDLSFLKQRGRREAREYLESLDGVPRAAAASVVLFSLGGHAIPVDDLTLYVLRKEGAIDTGADAIEAQAFLERHITAAEAPAFTLLLSRYVSSHAVRVDVEAIPAMMHPPAPKSGPEKGIPKVEPPPPLKAEPVPAKPRGKPEAVSKTPSKVVAKSQSAKTTARPTAAGKAGAGSASVAKSSPKAEVTSKATPKLEPKAKSRVKTETSIKPASAKHKKQATTAKTRK